MLPLTQGTLTADQVTTILRDSPVIVVDRGMEVLDLNLNVVADITSDYKAGSLSANSQQLIHRTGTVTIDRDIDYGTQLLRPYLLLPYQGMVARFNRGAYVATKPATQFGDSSLSNQVTVASRLTQLNRLYGDAVNFDDSDTFGPAIMHIFDLAGIPASHVRLDGTRVDAVIGPMSFPLLPDPNDTYPVPVDAVADSSNGTTFLRMINALCGKNNYRGVWDDWDGYFRVDPYLDPAVRSPEFTLDYDDPARATVGRVRTKTRDISATPNVWRFIQSNLTVQPSEGAGMYTVANTDDGDTSIEARGGGALTGGVWVGVGVNTSVIQLDAVDQATLVALGDQRVASDKAVATTFDITTSPFPAAWHEDVYLYTDSAVAPGPMKVLSTGWTEDHGNSRTPPGNMQHSLRLVG